MAFLYCVLLLLTMQLNVKLSEEQRKWPPKMCNVFTLIFLQEMTLVQLIDNSRVYGRMDTLHRAGPEMGFVPLEDII